MNLDDLSESEVATLPVDVLAYQLLVRAGGANAWNSNSRTHVLMMADRPQYARNGAAVAAFSSAWHWLFTNGLLAPDWQQDGAGWYLITTAGRVAIAEGLDYVRALSRISHELVPELERRVRPQFLMGEFELAAFAAMQEIEIQVRARSPQIDQKYIGRDLMRQAFNPDAGPLADFDIPAAERLGQSDLYAGAIGYFKNPLSHRRVDFASSTVASEIILFADLLLRMLPPVETALGGLRDE